MSYYEEVYLKRLNRYGIDFQTRMQRQREENFHRQLLKSVYYVTFEYLDEECEGEFTPCKQNETKTIHYLLTDVNLNIPGGTILWLPDKDMKNDQAAWAYFYGQEDNMLKDELKSRSRNKTLYTENLKLSFFITPINGKINKDDYLEVGEGELLEAYVVTGYDRQSTDGVEFVSVDPQYIRDLTPPPEPTAADNPDEFYWFNQGGSE